MYQLGGFRRPHDITLASWLVFEHVELPVCSDGRPSSVWGFMSWRGRAGTHNWPDGQMICGGRSLDAPYTLPVSVYCVFLTAAARAISINDLMVTPKKARRELKQLSPA